jgi:hypothetical protein
LFESVRGKERERNRGIREREGKGLERGKERMGVEREFLRV